MFGDPKTRAKDLVKRMGKPAIEIEVGGEPKDEGADMGLEAAMDELFAAPPGKRAAAFRNAMAICESSSEGSEE